MYKYMYKVLEYSAYVYALGNVRIEARDHDQVSLSHSHRWFVSSLKVNCVSFVSCFAHIDLLYRSPIFMYFNTNNAADDVDTLVDDYNDDGGDDDNGCVVTSRYSCALHCKSNAFRRYLRQQANRRAASVDRAIAVKKSLYIIASLPRRVLILLNVLTNSACTIFIRMTMRRCCAVVWHLMGWAAPTCFACAEIALRCPLTGCRVHLCVYVQCLRIVMYTTTKRCVCLCVQSTSVKR